MKRRTVRPGDVVLIPLENGKFAVTRVLYLSHRYKDVSLLGVYNKPVRERAMPTDLAEMPLLVYTSQKPIQQNRWIDIGHTPLKESERGLSKRIVGGDVWLEDEHLRPATSDDLQTLPHMQVLGAVLVEKRAEQFLAQQGNS